MHSQPGQEIDRQADSYRGRIKRQVYMVVNMHSQPGQEIDRQADSYRGRIQRQVNMVVNIHIQPGQETDRQTDRQKVTEVGCKSKSIMVVHMHSQPQ